MTGAIARPTTPSGSNSATRRQGVVSVAHGAARRDRTATASPPRSPTSSPTNRSPKAASGCPSPAAVGRSYQVRIEAGLVDEYGQSFVGDERPSFVTGPERFAPYLDALEGLQSSIRGSASPVGGDGAGGHLAARATVSGDAPGFLRVRGLRGGTVGPRPRASRSRTARTPSAGGTAGRPRGSAPGSAGLRPGPRRRGRDDHGGGPSARARVVRSPGRSPGFQVTKLALSARLDGEKVSAWIHDITAAKLLAPVAGVTTSLVVEGRAAAVRPLSATRRGMSGSSSPPPAARDKKRAPRDRAVTALLLARRGADSTFVAAGSHEKTIAQRSARWYVTDDRFTYKPGEKVYVKGWVRWTDNGVESRPGAAGARQTRSRTRSPTRAATELASGTAKLHGAGRLRSRGRAAREREPRHGDVLVRDATAVDPPPDLDRRSSARRRTRCTLTDDVTHAGATPLVARREHRDDAPRRSTTRAAAWPARRSTGTRR